MVGKSWTAKLPDGLLQPASALELLAGTLEVRTRGKSIVSLLEGGSRGGG